jgi:hypothetical protein
MKTLQASHKQLPSDLLRPISRLPFTWSVIKALWVFSPAPRNGRRQERTDMPRTAREWFEILSAERQKRFKKTATARIRRRLFPQHRTLADHYFQQAFLDFLDSDDLWEEFKPPLVVGRAIFRYLNDADAGRLKVENYQEHIERAEASQPPLYEATISVESDLSNKLLVEAIKRVLAPTQVRLIEAAIAHRTFRGGSIDNAELAEILGVDVEDVRRALECIRNRLKRHGWSRREIF